MISLTDIQFVIVLYKCKLQDSITFNTLSANIEEINAGKQIKHNIFVYDNSPVLQDKPTLNSNWNLFYQTDVTNGGLSIAYNKAAIYAKNQGKKFLFLLDQDTELPANSLKAYVDAININPDINLFAPILKIQNGQIMSPCQYVNKWGKLINHINTGKASLSQFVPVNSGLCINLDSYLAVGGYNENVRIDGADFQFIERFKKKYDDFFILDLTFQQDFSMFEEDINKVLDRYKLFLNDVKNFETQHWSDRLYYYRIIGIRTLKLTLQTKSTKVVAAFLKNLF